ncbi:VirB4 family type IV secretion system protein [Halalkalibacter flavus]|uniref:VirB4 family type IV secretion system protein n=1 Tax=Halalkalibacter flavus TaxID=3090668 RepID=UPI002FC5FB48
MKLPTWLDFSKKKDQTHDDLLEKSMMNANLPLLNKLSPDSLYEDENYVRSGGNYTRTYCAVEFETVISQEHIQRLTEISENVSVTQYLKEYDPEMARKQISLSIKQNRNKIESRYVSEDVKARAEAEIKDNEMLLRNLSIKNERMFLFQLLIHIVASSKEELDQLSQLVRSTAGSICKLVYPRLRGKDAFDSFLPFATNKVYDLTYRPMTSEAVSYFFPFHENEIYHKNGLMYGTNISTGNVVKVEDRSLVNKHMFILGISGSGKSTFLMTYMLRKFMKNERIIALDPKGDYGKLFQKLGGEWIQFKLDGDKRINPFDIPVVSAQADDEGNTVETNALYDKISTLIIMFKLMYRNMTDLQEDVLSEVLLDLYASEKYGPVSITPETNINELKPEDMPIMMDLYNFLSNLKDRDRKRYDILEEFHQTLSAYAKGIYQNIFNGHTNVDTKSNLVVYDIKPIAKIEKVKRVAYFNILASQRYEIINGDRKDTSLVVDEAHNIADPNVVVAMEYLFEMMKVLREFNCSIVCATQSLADFLSAKTEHRNYGEAVILQSVQQLYLKMKAQEVKMVNEHMHLNLSENEMSFLTVKEGLKDSDSGKGFFYVGSSKVKMEIFLTGIEEELWFKKNYKVLEQ